MKLGILKADAVKPEFAAEFGEYPDMFADVLLAVDGKAVGGLPIDSIIAMIVGREVGASSGCMRSRGSALAGCLPPSVMCPTRTLLSRNRCSGMSVRLMMMTRSRLNSRRLPWVTSR